MRFLILLVFLVLSMALAEPVQFRTPDGLTVHAQHTPVARPRGVVLLFHAAGRNRHDYRAVAQRLAHEGFASLAVDQRFGGTYDGVPNRTVQNLGQRLFTEQDVLAEMHAAFSWLRRTYPQARVFAMGSGQSATLLFPFAERRANLAGILAFSPNPTDLTDHDALSSARRLKVRTFVTSSDDPYELRAANALYAAVTAPGKARFVPAGFALSGVSSLDPDKMMNEAASAAYWAAVLQFLASR